MLLKIILVATYILLVHSTPLLADEAVSSNISFDLGEIVITQEGKATHISPHITEITSKDIEQKNAQSIDEALDFVPGVRLTVGSKNEPYAMIRGFNQDELLILLDGIPIAGPYYGYVDLNQIPAESIAKIKVIKGAVSPLYGANSMGGVINIVTKKATEKPSVVAEASISEHDTQFYTLSCGAKYKKASFWISAGHRESDGFVLSDDFDSQRNEDRGLRDNSHYSKNNVFLKIGLENDEEDNITAFFNYIENEKGIPPHTSSTRPRFWRFTEWDRSMIGLAGKYRLRDDLLFKGRVYYDKYDNTLNSYDDASYTTQANSSSWTSIYDEYAIGNSIYLDFRPSDDHYIGGAFNFKKDVHKEQDDVDEEWEDYETHTYSFGLEDEIRFIDEKLRILVGMSYDILDQVRSASGNIGDNIDSFNPTCRMNYYITPETLTYVSVSQRTQFPQMNHLYGNTSGNPNLTEQKNLNYETGIKYDIPDIADIELSYFYNDVKDLIERASRDDPYLNTSKAVFEGVEADIRANIGEHFFARVGYTYLDACDKNPSLLGRSQKELSYIPMHKADVECNVVTDFGFSWNLLGSYHGRRYYYDSSGVQFALGGYLVWNTKVSQKLFDHFEASLFIENILDRDYQEEEGYPQPGRTLILSIKGSF